jgi:hypothetical protein
MNYARVRSYKVAQLVEGKAVGSAQAKGSYFVLFDGRRLYINAVELPIMAKRDPLPSSTYL